MKDLTWMRAEAKGRQAKLRSLYERHERLQENGKLDTVQYQVKRLKLESTRITIDDTLRMLQRQCSLITCWLVGAEK
ncbi:hypothetical protein EYC59_02975 [Candidatus Saccharibacteria bacterium]|nr:MAG: hypothetical protein EYC59_02975 [Candidatus Saccharibacteria bacterium]